MAILANRVKTKNYLKELLKIVLLSVQKSIAYILVIFCCWLLYFSSSHISKASLEVGGNILSFGNLIYNGISYNINLIHDKISHFNNLQSENIRLKLELEKLRNTYKDLTLMQEENIELKELLNLANSVETTYITAKIIGLNITPFSSTAILEGGSNDGIEIDDLVESSNGLVGRIVNVSNNYSTAMLITDPNSRIPVITGKSKERGIIANQDDTLKLIYLKEGHNVQEGELIYTSGDGKIYTNGLIVAVVEKVNNHGVFVKILSDLNDIKFVMIKSKIGQNF